MSFSLNQILLIPLLNVRKTGNTQLFFVVSLWRESSLKRGTTISTGFHDSYLRFWLVLLVFTWLLAYFFFPYICCCVYPPANVFVFEDFNFHHKEWLTYSGGTDRFAVLWYNFSISNKFPQNVNFSAQITGCRSHSLSLLDLFLFSLALVFVI